ncbi:MAG: hypothetical protein ACJA0S_001435 [Rickettsiales bacterium]|jgi:hypothetical protein
MKENIPQYHCLLENALDFRKNLHALNAIISDKIFSSDEILEIMSQIVPIKEHIESLEVKYWKYYPK